MANLQNTARRIRSVEATKKITKAMELVSSAKLKKAKDEFEVTKLVGEYVRRNLSDTAYEVASESNQFQFIDPNVEGKTLFIVIAGDMGLCGGYNTNIAKLAYESSKPGDKFILLGKKTYSYLSHKKCDILNTYTDMTRNTNMFETFLVAKEAMDLFDAGEIVSIKIVYTHFENSVTFIPKVYSVIPIKEPKVKMVDNFDYENDPLRIIQQLLRDFLNSVIYTSLIEAKVCEYASSRMAMENATDNAEEIQEKLLLQYNRARQAAITQEISEIVAGSDAL